MKKLIFAISLTILLSCVQRISAEEQHKQRIISLAPSTTEILFSLGLDEQIVGVTTFCNYPPQAQDKEKVGTFSQPDIERILALKPEIIFATGLEQALTVEKLRKLNLKVYVSDPVNIQELFASIQEIGRLTQREKQARDLVNQMERRIEQIRAKVKVIPQAQRPKVFIEIWQNPLMTAGRGSFVDELVGLAGGINIAYDVPRPYSYFSAEQVIKRNPDFIILGYMDETRPEITVKSRLGWKQINAVKNNHIYNDINPDLFLRPGPRLAEGLTEIYNRLYP